ncbi:MAG: HAD family hydrolase [Planctomycetota bacterium]
MKRFHFDVVVFDLDGTLVATERTWPDAGRAASLRFLAEPGATRFDIPSADGWLEMIGLPLPKAFAASFPELDEGARARLIELCDEEQNKLLGRGRAQVLPGVEQALDALRADGVQMGVASNCGRDYLGAMMDGLGLDSWISEARCLATPGVRNKADMIEDLLLSFGTRSAVVVGDRQSDRDAAWNNGLPFVHVPRGYGLEGSVRAEAMLDGVDQLPELLQRRTDALDAILARAAGAPIEVTGRPKSGVSLLERDLASRAADVSGDRPVGGTGGDPLSVHCVADQEVLLRRARGLRIGPAPIEDLAQRLRSAESPRSGDLVVDLSNVIVPTLGGVPAGA